MKREDLKKPLFVFAQNWYKPEACSECSEFNFVILPEGAAAYCNLIEDNEPCTIAEVVGEFEFHSSALVTLESLSQSETD